MKINGYRFLLACFCSLFLLSAAAQETGRSVEQCLSNASRSMQADQPQLALEFVDEALRIDSLSQDAWLMKIRVCSRMRRYEDAVEACIRLKACPGERPVELYTRWVSIYMNTNNAEAARDIVEEGLALFPESFALTYNKGHVLMSLKQYAEAYQCYERAFAMDPLADGPPLMLGMRADGAGRLAQALLFYLQNLLIDPQSDAAPVIMHQLVSWLNRETLPETARDVDFLLLEAMRDIQPEQSAFGLPYTILSRSLDVVLRDLPVRDDGYEIRPFRQAENPLNETCRMFYADMRSRGLLTAFLHNAVVLSANGQNTEWLKSHPEEIRRLADYVGEHIHYFEKNK